MLLRVMTARSMFLPSPQTFFAVLIGAFALGQAAPNMENLLTAAGAAGSIYDTIDRVRIFYKSIRPCV